MKYITYPVEAAEGITPVPRCHEYLTTWSCDKQLILASFYFWNSGTQVQMTQRGLMLSLLYQILEQCPELAPLVCPNRWEAVCLFGDILQEWEEQELHDTLRSTIKNVRKLNGTIALFVDGLDEFDGQPEVLISLFQEILDFPDVKICVASRPWVEFQDAFQHKPSLELEKLTYDDIKSFVTSRFHNEPIFKQLRRQEAEFADQLVEDIVSKASGVFLWVTLVVSSLIAGMGFGDRVSDLQKRLNILPPDLSKLYEKMLQSLDEFYLEHAAQLFSLVGANSEPMNLMLASFADEDDPAFALSREMRPISPDEMCQRSDAMRRRINSRSKGLLEVKGNVLNIEPSSILQYQHCTIQYLHRTVKDYIERPDVQITFRSAMISPFDPHLRLLAGHLALIKSLDAERTNIEDSFATHFPKCLQSAKAVLPNSIPTMVLLLDELDEVHSNMMEMYCKVYCKGSILSVIRISTIINELIGDGKITLSSLLRWGVGQPFISIALRFGITDYVQARAEGECLPYAVDKFSYGKTSRYQWPLLIDAINFEYQESQMSKNYDSGLFMVRCLLNKGANPTFLIPESEVGDKKTSPLIELIFQLFQSVCEWDGNVFEDSHSHFWAKVTSLCSRAGKIDNEAIDMALHKFLDAKMLIRPKPGLRTYFRWNGARRSFRKAVQYFAEGGNNKKDFAKLVVELRVGVSQIIKVAHNGRPLTPPHPRTLHALNY
jgi:NACHT domain